MSPTQVTVMINGANFLSAAGGSVLLGYFGRKSLMIVNQFICIVGMIGMWVFSAFVPNDTMMYILVIGFIVAFEFGPGPIVWLYVSEVCNDKATSVNTVVNWFWTLFMSIMTLYLSNWLEGYIWFLFGITATIGFFYIMIFMKETRGVAPDKLKTLYFKGDQKQYDPIM